MFTSLFRLCEARRSRPRPDLPELAGTFETLLALALMALTIGAAWHDMGESGDEDEEAAASRRSSRF